MQLRKYTWSRRNFPLYDDARPFLASLRNKGFYIIIASHREQGTFEPTERWLRMHNLAYDEIHLSNDKSVLFNDLCAIVDDSPSVLDKAKGAGIIRVGLRCPWNEKTNHPLFDTLPEILVYLDSGVVSLPAEQYGFGRRVTRNSLMTGCVHLVIDNGGVCSNNLVND